MNKEDDINNFLDSHREIRREDHKRFKEQQELDIQKKVEKENESSLFDAISEGEKFAKQKYGTIRDSIGVAKEMWRKVEPYCAPAIKVIKFFWNQYNEKIYQRYAYKRVDGVKSLSYEKSAVTILSTIGVLIALYVSAGPVAGYMVDLTTDTWKLVRSKEETLYFSKPVLVDSGGYYEVNGCTSLTECEGGETARIFDIKDNAAMDIIYYLKLKGGFDPRDDVVSAFTGHLNECTVTRYRDKSFKFGSIRRHSEISKAICKPVSN